MAIFVDNTSVTRRDDLTFQQGEGVDTKSLAWSRQEARWSLTNDLRTGSDGMRDAGVKWLPLETGERLNAYRARLSRSHLLGAYADAIEKLVSKPFSREVTFSNEERLPEKLALMHEDIARDGTGQSTFWRDVFEDALDRGLTFVLVDFPPVGGEQTRADELANRVHPYMVHVKADQLIGVRMRRRAVDGREEISQIRIKLTKVEERENFGEEEIQFIHVYTAPPDLSIATPEEVAALPDEELSAMFEVWRLNPETDEWQLVVPPQTYSYPGIPLVPLYFCRQASFEGRPCLWKLAEANLEHWQKKSDRDNLMHVAHVPILARYGFTEKELKKNLTVGAGRSVGTTQKDARMEYVDTRPAAAALQISKEDIEHLEEQMERMGLEPLVRRAASSLATSMMLGDAKEMNLLQAWALLTEAFILQCYEVASIWVDEEVPEDFEADLFSEFGLSARATENLALLDKARARGDISRRTYLEELKRYAALAEGISVEDELDRLEDEEATQPTGFVGLQEPEPEEEEDEEAA